MPKERLRLALSVAERCFLFAATKTEKYKSNTKCTNQLRTEKHLNSFLMNLKAFRQNNQNKYLQQGSHSQRRQ